MEDDGMLTPQADAFAVSGAAFGDYLDPPSIGGPPPVTATDTAASIINHFVCIKYTT